MQQEAQELANDATAAREGNDRGDRDGVAGTGLGDGDGDGNRADAGDRDGDDDSGKWGLLGLLGLAGLLGLRRRDNNHHVHTDNTNRRI
jgi:MYXO-CTERM domain-containing protein